MKIRNVLIGILFATSLLVFLLLIKQSNDYSESLGEQEQLSKQLNEIRSQKEELKLELFKKTVELELCEEDSNSEKIKD